VMARVSWKLKVIDFRERAKERTSKRTHSMWMGPNTSWATKKDSRVGERPRGGMVR